MPEQPPRILIVEDEEKIARFVELELQHDGYETEKCHDGRAALAILEQGGFDLCLLDVMLPGLNGLELLRRLRKLSDIPVIMLTARDAVMDKVSALDMGCNDYLTKPFAIEELLARIRALLRTRALQQPAADAQTLACGPLVLNPAAHSVAYDGTPVALTAKEFAMLELMLQNRGIVLSRDSFLTRVWGYDYMGETNVVDVYIRSLRSKIDEVFGLRLIETVRGVGYVIK